ncbi:unnamed protein product [Nezara viridula]|uniref:Ig-like domain-containing protein n=1 Tax=Nezara viridula TaxID=85310 RepID=A0A9P0HNY1_NEZVI|nr:unnamed protein product [Nezara viridula]
MSRRSPNGIPFLFEDFNLVSDSVLPRFAEPIQNVTVTIGKDALMACVVENLRNYKVAWVRVDTQTILSIHHHVITQNPRVSLSYNDHRSWYLHISNVQEIDRGWYMCQVNTDPMRSRAGYLQVVVPPRIVGGDSTKELVVRESTEMRLECHAEGYPEPYVMWRREDGKDMNYNGDIVNVVDGEILHMSRVSRLHMGTYLCIASNGVPPSISRRVSLKVQFPPMLSIPNQLEGAYIGQDVTLGCQTEAFPSSINYWTTDNGDMIVSGEKYETSSSDDGYSRFMTLKIRNVTSRDFGSYQCVAKNSLGETDGVIKLEVYFAQQLSFFQLIQKRRCHFFRSSTEGGDEGLTDWAKDLEDGALNTSALEKPGEKPPVALSLLITSSSVKAVSISVSEIPSPLSRTTAPTFVAVDKKWLRRWAGIVRAETMERPRKAFDRRGFESGKGGGVVSWLADLLSHS